MTTARIVALAIAAITTLIGIATAVGSLRDPAPTETGRERLLVAMHEAARAGFWFALAVLFAGVALIADAYSYRWFVMLPIGMAALRLATAALLARG